MGLHAVEEFGSGKRVGNGDANVVGLRVTNQFDRVLNVLPGFTGISELQEVTGANPLAPEIFASLDDLVYARTFVHRIQNLLRAGLCAHPYFGASGSTQGR